MTEPPVYFEEVRRRAAKRWEQLEQDPDLAGPWHQLFKQVQSPRHVVSELLQNADDAGATTASVEIQNGELVFCHNGEDFIKEHFTSLCRFGYSNKRALHTIGFRGIGFKSTFSLGDEVRLFTPSLSVCFHRRRFTEPVWIERNGRAIDRTEVRVVIRDEHRLRELERNLDDWTTSPASLLFFRSIRCLNVHGQEIEWLTQASGPVVDSHRMTLSSNPQVQVLLLQSQPESFQEEAIEEIHQERMVSLDEETSLPPCRVEIILGMKGRLFVILPTGVKTNLPFACNAPFIQDPARVKIKDPDTSPTNRWLLERVGTLAAEGMMAWLRREDLGAQERCEAYALLPDVDREDNSLEGNCACLVEEACEHALAEKPFLLTEDGMIEKERGCVSCPQTLLDVWSSEQVAKLFSENGRPILSRHVRSGDRRKLVNWNSIDEIKKIDVLRILESKHPPKPALWRQLLALWEYVSEGVVGYHYYRKPPSVRIVPVQGSDVLYAASEVVRLGEKKLLQSQEDWQFLAEYLLVLNQNWPSYLAEQRRTAEQQKAEPLGKLVDAAYKTLTALNLEQASDVSQMIQQVANSLFSKDECPLPVCIRIAHLAAALGANVSNEFQFVTRNGYRTPASQNVFADINRDLDTFVERDWYEAHILHEDYTRTFTSCTQEEWQQWVSSGRSGMLTFVPFTDTTKPFFDRDRFREFLRNRGVDGMPELPYRSSRFELNEWDFPADFWRHWENTARNDPEFWGRLLSRILEQPRTYWEKALATRAIQIASNGYWIQLTCKDILPSWIMKFRALPCLQDTNGRYREPAELLRHTPETDPLFGVEAFVRTEFDTEHTRPILIKLGVRETATGPKRLLDRLRALATVENPPVYEVEKWYRRLDQMLVKCSTEEFQQIKTAFAEEKIVLTGESEWVQSREVFLSADEENAPGAAVIHPAVRDLLMWSRIGVAERPTGDSAIQWLESISSGKKLSQDELRRVRALLPRYAERIWIECRHWLNLDGEWVPVDSLAYKLTIQTLIPWANLFRPLKQKTADLQKLTAEMCEHHPFVDLPSLSSCIEDRFEEEITELEEPQSKPWLVALGDGLSRIVLDKEDEATYIRDLGRQLVQTKWQGVTALETTPYIDGTPSGTPRRIDVLWKDTMLYVERKSMAKMARTVAQELGRAFGRLDIADAIKLCFERDTTFVAEYIEENFRLLPLDAPAENPKQYNEGEEEMPHDAGNSAVLSTSEMIHKEEAVETEEDATAIEVDKIRADGADGIILDGNIKETSDAQELAENRPASRRQTPRPPELELIERFARARGYIKDSVEGRFYHVDGSWIERVSGVSFPWERYSASGELQQCYWVKDHCLEREPLQLEADIWELCNRYPDKYTLVLADPNGVPVEFSGHRIRELQASGRLTLYPANYRLVYDHDMKA